MLQNGARGRNRILDTWERAVNGRILELRETRKRRNPENILATNLGRLVWLCRRNFALGSMVRLGFQSESLVRALAAHKARMTPKSL